MSDAPDTDTANAKAVLILGMHRSGTSCLAGSLERCGLYLGAVSRRARENPQGFLYELQDSVALNEEILVSNGGDWHQPPSRIIANSRQKRALHEIVERLSERVPWGIKDPRLLLVLEVWTEVLSSYALVGTFRHPAAVARSLKGRYRGEWMSEEVMYGLWARYNAELVRWHERHRFPLVEYDLADLESYCKTVAALALSLGLNPDIARLREFVSLDLDHYRPSQESIPAFCQETYTYLRENRYRPDISGGEFEAQLRRAQATYDGWQWSPDGLRRTLRPAARFLPPIVVRLGRRLLRRLDRHRR